MWRFLLFFMSFSLVLHADDSIVVNLSATSPLKLLFLEMHENNSFFDKEYQKQLKDVLIFDLNHNGKTKISDQKGMAHLITGTFQGKNWEIALSQKKSVTLTGTLSIDRKKVHQLSDAIYADLFQEEGIASSSIIYTNRFRAGFEKDASCWKSEVWQADYDGDNPRTLIKEEALCVAPTFVPLGKCGSFLYVSYKTGQSKIFLAPLNNPLEKKKIASLRGNQLMPAFSPQTQLVAFVSDVTGNPEVFLQLLSKNKEIEKPWQATFAPEGAQGSPTFSPDGKKLAFVSNKDGQPRIYVMTTPAAETKITTLKPTLITKQNRDNTCPSWSPDGKKLAFSALTKGIRQIWIYDFATKKETQVTNGQGHKENPAWAGNSHHLYYDVTDKQCSELYLIHITQKEPVKISKGRGDKRFPSWIPFST